MTDQDRTTIDVSDWMRTLARNWWLVLGLAVLGAVIGGLLVLSSPKTYTATSAVYIGQTTDANGDPIAGLTSNGKAVTELLSSQAVLDEIARRTGMGETAAKLRQGLTVSTPAQSNKATGSVVNIVTMAVTDTKKLRATRAANQAAAVLLENIGGDTKRKIALLEQQLAVGQKQLADSQARVAAAQKQLTAIASGGGSAAERAAASAPYVSIVQAAATEQQAYISADQHTQLMLLTAQQVEMPRVLHLAAVPDSPSGPSSSLNVAAGALAGLVIGIIAAFARRRFTER